MLALAGRCIGQQAPRSPLQRGLWRRPGRRSQAEGAGSGSVLSYADESFNAILELGFASSIRKEWEWRISRGESTRNLEAFRGWLEAGTDPDPAPSA